MKKLVIVSTLLLFHASKGQVFSQSNAGFENVAGQVDWVDIDSDGDLDLLQRGFGRNPDNTSFEKSFIYINDGFGSFSKLENVFEDHMLIKNIYDINGDGYVDFLISKQGFSSTGNTSIYLNNIATQGDISLLTILNDFGGDGFMADVDNDGDIDIVFSGQKLVQGQNGGWYFKTAIYQNEEGEFIELEIDENESGFFATDIQPIDFDLDGRIEIVLTGSYEDSIEGRFTNSETRLYTSNGNNYTQTHLDTLGLHSGNLVVFDINNNGYPDIVMTGEIQVMTSSSSFKKTPLTRVYYNENGSSFSIDENSPISPTIFGHINHGDFDNNGFTDLALIGNDFENNMDNRFGTLYSNSIGIFTEVSGESFPNVASGSVAWGDYDDDNDLDLVISGTFESSFDNLITSLYVNSEENFNGPPSSPINLSTNLMDEEFRLIWDASIDNETSSNALTYNWYLRAETDTIISSNSLFSGRRKIVEDGNLGYGTNHILTRFMNPGDYYWSVQAIDNGFQSSPFSEESFFHVNFPPVINSISKSSQVEDVPFEITLNDITVSDPDNTYPDDFIILIQSGENYNFSGNTITPLKDFFGEITIPVIVKDHLDESNIYELTVIIENVNDIPEITEQLVELTTEEDTPTSISLNDISVINLDVPYPDGFVLEIHEGSNYSFDNTLLTPVLDFNGLLEVPVTVNDGEDSSSEFILQIEVTPVNDIPEITEQIIELVTEEDTPISISLNDISVINLDVPYPDGFTLGISKGINYSIDNTLLTPDLDFNGLLEVPVTVNDGEDSSNEFILQIEVTPVNDIPEITQQIVELTINEGEILEISLNHISVINLDSPYPEGFTMNIQEGEGYTIEESSVVPNIGTFGLLSVPVTVNDGEDESNVFELEVISSPVVTSVRSNNDNYIIYPNPAGKRLFIEALDNDLDLTFVITDLSGQNILTLKATNNLEYIDLKGIDDGIYFLIVRDNIKRILTRKIRVESR